MGCTGSKSAEGVTAAAVPTKPVSAPQTSSTSSASTEKVSAPAAPAVTAAASETKPVETVVKAVEEPVKKEEVAAPVAVPQKVEEVKQPEPAKVEQAKKTEAVPIKKAEEPAKKVEVPKKAEETVKAVEESKKAPEQAKKVAETKKVAEPAKKAPEPVKKAPEPAKKVAEPVKKAEEPKKVAEPAPKAAEPAKVGETSESAKSKAALAAAAAAAAAKNTPAAKKKAEKAAKAAKKAADLAAAVAKVTKEKEKAAAAAASSSANNTSVATTTPSIATQPHPFFDFFTATFKSPPEVITSTGSVMDPNSAFRGPLSLSLLICDVIRELEGEEEVAIIPVIKAIAELAPTPEGKSLALRGLTVAETKDAYEALEKAIPEINNSQFISYFNNKASQSKADGTSPLVAAITQRRVKTVEYLVAEGADVNRPWSVLSTEQPMTLLAHFGLRTLIPLFVSKGASYHFDYFSQKNNGTDSATGNANQGRYEPIFAAVQSAYEPKETLTLFLDAGVSPNAKDSTGKRLLDWTATHANPSLVPFLIEKGADPVPVQFPLDTTSAQKNVHTETYIHSLARANAVDVLKQVRSVLESKGAFTCFDDIKNCDGETPLHIAAQQDAKETVEYLLNEGKCNPNIQTSIYDCNNNKRDELVLSYTPLFYAINRGALESAKLLLAAGARPDAIVPPFPPMGTNNSLVSVALVKADDYITRFEKEEIIANDMERRLSEVKTIPLEANPALKFQVIRLRKELEEKRKIIRDLQISAAGAIGITSLLVNATTEQPNVQFEIPNTPMTKAAYASPLAAADENGYTTLHWACRSHAANVNTIKSLLSVPGVKDLVNAKTITGETPLSLLILRGDKEALAVANVLIKAGADVNAVNNDNKSILTRLCQTFNLEFIAALIDAGAIKTQEHIDAFDEALRRLAEDDKKVSVELYKSVSLAGKVPRVHVPHTELPFRGAILKVREELKKFTVIKEEVNDEAKRETNSSNANKKKKKRK